MWQELERLILAWDAGEPCFFAIRDLICDLGFPRAAKNHETLCVRYDGTIIRECSLVVKVHEKKLQDYLEQEEVCIEASEKNGGMYANGWWRS